jgi:uncharacterized protein with von Willebrand factor type A (vWA) domain
MNDFHYSDLHPLGANQLSQIDAAKYVSAAVISGIQYAGEREKWRSRIESLRAAYGKYGETEQNALEARRLQTDLARFAIERLAEKDDSQGILAVFQSYSASAPDFLGKVVDMVEIALRGEGNNFTKAS